jgi:ABC-type transport system substrate-binding protein
VDREENANFPGFRVSRQPNPIGEMTRYLISQAPVAENRFTGRNFARYMNQEYNDLIERYFLTIPKPERMEILRQIVRHQSENLQQMGLFYNVQSVAISKRVQDVMNSGVSGFNQAWNAYAWNIS